MQRAGYSESTPQIDQVIDSLFTNPSDRFLRSAISREEGQFLRGFAAQPNVRNSVEVGCANGVSTLYICSGLAGKQPVSHTAIDPGQTSGYERRGVNNVARAGIDFFRFLEQPSEVALPNLLASGARYDLSLIDGLHTADQTLVDFYYLDRMTTVGGYVIIDDVNSPAVNKAVHYVSTYPNYKLVSTSGARGLRRRVINGVKMGASLATWPLKKVLGEPLVREFFDISLLQPNTLWTIDSCTMAAFQKTGEFERDTNWFRGM